MAFLLPVFRGVVSPHCLNKNIGQKVSIIKEGLFPFKRSLFKGLAKRQSAIVARTFSTLRFASGKNTKFRFITGGFGALLGFSAATNMDRGEVSRCVQDLKIIRCANAAEASDEDEDDFEEKRKITKKKRSAQFNFIADAIESATPAVVYIEVCHVTKIPGDFLLDLNGLTTHSFMNRPQ